MLVVTFEIWPKGDKEKARQLGCIMLANDGTGTLEKGNYNVVASHTGKYFGTRAGAFKRGKVKGFPRKLSPYRLLYRALENIGET